MPSANGVYSLPPGYLAVTGTTIQASQHNPPLEDIGAALTLRLSRDGTAPMTGPLNAAVGTVTAPSIVFSTDASSGLYKTATGIGMAIGGSKVAEFVSGGIVGARYVGELISTSGQTLQPLCVWPAGQTLSRTAYPDMWAFAQIEIAAGSTFYNNGDGSTTFGIGDLRGRSMFYRDNMGGTAAGRITTALSGIDGTVVGATGGLQASAIPQGCLPNVALSASVSGSVTQTNQGAGGFYIPWTNGIGAQNLTPGGGSFYTVMTGFSLAPSVISSGTMTGGTSSLNGGVAQTPLNRMTPAMICSAMLFVGGPS